MALDSLGILPAAGKATRFNGYFKELLPIGNITILEQAAGVLGSLCDEVLLVSSREKISEHVRVMGHSVKYAIQQGDNDIWSAIVESFFIEAKRYYFMMPDCVVSTFPVIEGIDFVLGTFVTMDPGRFGVLRDGVIVNKDADQAVPVRAWGVLSWTRAVVEFWKGGPDVLDYTDAFNQAMAAFGFETFELDYYYDMASFDDYVRYLETR